MTDEAADRNDDGPFPIEFEVPQLSRIRNAISGGDANFSADRKAVDSITEATPNGLEGLQAVIEALHRFKLRAVRTVAEESDVRQFLHIGMVTPSTAMVYEDILPLVPDARIVYASYDTTTLAHVHTLWRDAPDGAVAHVHSPFDNPQRILQGAAETLDLTKPVAVVLATSLNVVTDEVAQNLVDALRATLVAGSYVVMAQTSLDIFAHGTAEVVAVLNAVLDEPYIARTRAEIARHLEGFDLLDPGLVPIEQWRPDGDPPFLPDGQLIPLYGALGHNPEPTRSSASQPSWMPASKSGLQQGRHEPVGGGRVAGPVMEQRHDLRSGLGQRRGDNRLPRPSGRTRWHAVPSFLHTLQDPPRPNGPAKRRPGGRHMSLDLSHDRAGGDHRVADVAVDLLVELSPDPDPTPPPTARPRPTLPLGVGYRRQLGTRRHVR